MIVLSAPLASDTIFPNYTTHFLFIYLASLLWEATAPLPFLAPLCYNCNPLMQEPRNTCSRDIRKSKTRDIIFLLVKLMGSSKSNILKTTATTNRSSDLNSTMKKKHRLKKKIFGGICIKRQY